MPSCLRLSHCDDVFSDCYELNDQAILAMASFGHNLQSIAMSRCHNVTIAAVKELAKLPKLRSINVFGCYTDVYPHIEVRLQQLTTVVAD